MVKYLAIFLATAASVFAYFEISNDVPTVFDMAGGTEWRLWAGNDLADSMYNGSAGILFDADFSSVLVGTWTPGEWKTNATIMGFNAADPIYQGDNLTAIGAAAAQEVATEDSTAVGVRAGYRTVGDALVAVGNGAGEYNSGTYNTAVGYGAFSTWTADAGSAGTVADVDEDNDQVTFTVGHGWGAVGTYILLDASTTDTLPAGLSSNPEVWIVIDADTVECKTDSFTDDGTGTHTLTPKVTYTNSTALGYNAEPDASNQVMLGDTNVTQVKTAGTVVAAGVTLSGDLTTAGRVVAVTRVTTSPYAILATDEEIFCDTDDGAITVNLPASLEGKRYRVINCGSSANDVTVASAFDDIRGGVSATLTDGEIIVLTYESTEGWW